MNPGFRHHKPASTWCDGNAITLLENGETYFPALEAAIDEARHDVLIESYIFAPDVTGRRIAASLIRAVRRGVAVRVTIDGFGGRSFLRGLKDDLVAAGVQVLIFRPEVRMLSPRLRRLRRLHRKTAVIDAHLAFVGGINIIDDFDPGINHPRLDYAVRVEGPVLGTIITTVHRLWRLLAWTNAHLAIRAPVTSHAMTDPAGNIRSAFVMRDNLRHRKDIENAYLEAIDNARNEILLANAYFLPGRRFRRALLEAASRGVKIRLLLQGLSDHPLMFHATRHLYPLLFKHGIRLFEYQRSILHAKVAVIDHHWATVGSSNIDPFSLMLAREGNILVDDPGFATQLETSLEAAIDDGAQELFRKDLTDQSRFRHFLCWLSYHAVRLMAGIAGDED